MLNKVTLIGRLGKDPEIRTVGNQQKVASFGLATSEKYTDKQGTKVEHTTWHNIEIWGKLAEVAEKYVKKGQLLYVEGRIKFEEWEKDGVKRHTTKINVREMTMLGRNEQSTPQHSDTSNVPDDAFVPPSGEGDDDLPF